MNDKLLHGFVAANPVLHYVAAAAGALLVVGLGLWLQKRGGAEAKQA